MARFETCKGSTISKDLTPQNPEAKTLFVVAHGIGRSAEMQVDLIEKLHALNKESGAAGEIWAPILPWAGTRGTLFAFGDLNTVVSDLCNELDKIWQTGSYDRIVLIGNSMGGLVLRAMYVNAVKTAKANETRRDWWQPTERDRMILLAAVNRGVGPTHHMKLARSLGYGLASGFLTSIERILPHMVNMVRRNSVFVSKLRLGWVENAKALQGLTVVQLLGSRDDVVGPNDSLDLVTGANFFYIDVPNTSHEDILLLEENPQRAQAVHNALTLDHEALRREEVRPWGLKRPLGGQIAQGEEGRAKGKADQVDNVAFVVHGIRDYGYWTDKIARRIWKLGVENRTKELIFERVVESYGYFGMGPFLLPWNRRKKVDWMLERYIEARSKYPDADFHFVGHSHGTYLLAKLLELFEDCRFANIVFAGSIVRQGYQWSDRKNARQIKRVLNFVATGDWVVAFFPRTLDLWNIQDLGGAGHLGFEKMPSEQEFHQIEYVVGGHSSAREEEMWDGIARFVIGDPATGLPSPLEEFQRQQQEVPGHLEQKRSGWWEKFVDAFSPVSILLLVGLPILALGTIPYALVTWVAPFVLDVLQKAAPLFSPTMALAAFVLLGSIFTASQAKHGRDAGLVRSFSGAAILVGTGALLWQVFPSIESFAGQAYSIEPAAHATISTLLVLLWIWVVLWVLRRV